MQHHCPLCNKCYIPDIQGMHPSTMKIGEEDFVAHSHCIDETIAEYNKLKGKKAEAYMSTILKKLSQS